VKLHFDATFLENRFHLSQKMSSAIQTVNVSVRAPEDCQDLIAEILCS